MEDEQENYLEATEYDLPSVELSPVNVDEITDPKGGFNETFGGYCMFDAPNHVRSTRRYVVRAGESTGGYRYAGISPAELKVYAAMYPEQRDVFDRVFTLKPHDKGLYFILPTGYGKTYMLAGLAEIAQKMGTVCIVICPASVRPHIESVVYQFGIRIRKYIHHASPSFMKEIKLLKTHGHSITFLIDEAHELMRSQIDTENEILREIYHTTGSTGKIFLFTATPVRWHLSNLALIRLCWSRDILSKYAALMPRDNEEFDRIYRRNENYLLTKLIANIGHSLVYRQSSTRVPIVKSPEYKFMPLSYRDSVLHYSVIDPESRKSAIYNRMRDIRNVELQYAKLVFIAKLAKMSRRPIMVYTNFINILRMLCLDVMPVNDDEKEIKDLAHEHEIPPDYAAVFKDIPVQFMSKSRPPAELDDIFDLTNSDDNVHGDNVKIVFIGPGMSAGIEFYKINRVIFMSPLDDVKTYTQVVGRVARPQSLPDLKGDARSIEVLVLISIFNPKYLTQCGDQLRETREQNTHEKMEELERTSEFLALILAGAEQSIAERFSDKNDFNDENDTFLDDNVGGAPQRPGNKWSPCNMLGGLYWHDLDIL